jgi:hypothetical protein
MPYVDNFFTSIENKDAYKTLIPWAWNTHLNYTPSV